MPTLPAALASVLAILRTDPRSLASKSLAVRRELPFGQFGQANDARTNNGATGCTDTCIQFLTLMIRQRWYTHDQIRGLANNRTPLKGLSYPQVAYLASRLGLPYVVTLGLSADAILRLVRTRGPVMVGEMYGDHPEWKGYTYRGVKADGKPNGYAWPLGKAGKTQLAGFVGRHAIVLVAIGKIADWGGREGVYVIEPNHGSTSRPERVAYDVITLDQARRLINRYGVVNGKTYAYHPTRDLRGT